MTKKCDKCGEEWPETARICFTCGSRFDGETREGRTDEETQEEDVPRPPRQEKGQRPLYKQIQHSLILAIYVGLIITVAYLTYTLSDSYVIEDLPYEPICIALVCGLGLIKFVDYIFYAVDFNIQTKDFQGMPEFLYRRVMMRSVRGLIMYLTMGIVVALLFPVFDFSISLIDMPRNAPLILSGLLVAFATYHLLWMGYIFIVKRKEGLSQLSGRITRAFDPMKDYGVWAKLSQLWGPHQNIALDRESEIAWQIEKYLYIGLLALFVIGVVQSIATQGVFPTDEQFPWKIIFLLSSVTVLVIRLVYFYFRHREIYRLSWEERKGKIKELIVSGFKRGVFIFVGLVIVIVFTSIDSSLSSYSGDGGPPYQFSLLILFFFALVFESMWIGDMYWLKKPPEKEEEKRAVIEDVFVVDKSGNLLAHHARRMQPDMDDDILMGMFTAIQDFMAETFKSQGNESGNLNTLHYGNFRILIEHGEYAYIAMVITGDETPQLRKKLQETVSTIHRKYKSILKDWDGSQDKLSGINKQVKELIGDQI